MFTSLCDTTGKQSVIPFFHTLYFLPFPVAPLMDIECVNRRQCHIVLWMWWWWQQIVRAQTCNTSFSACHPNTCSHTNLLHPLPSPPPLSIHTEPNSYKHCQCLSKGVRGEGHMWLRPEDVIAADNKSALVWILATLAQEIRTKARKLG